MTYPPPAREIVIKSTDDHTNFLPGANQIVLESDTGKQKIGDGVTHYNDLPYKTVETLVRRDFPISFNTPGLHDGVNLFTPQVGELFLDSWVSIEAVWDDDADPTNNVELLLGLDGFTAPQVAALDAANGAVVSAADANGWLGVTRVGGSGVYIHQAAEAVPYKARVALFNAAGDTDLGAPTTAHGHLTVHIISVPPTI